MYLLGQGEGLFGDGYLDNKKWGHVWFFIAEHSEECIQEHLIFVLPVGVIQSACYSQQDKPKEIEMQLEYIILLMGQP